jgi:hypothetical protein
VFLTPKEKKDQIIDPVWSWIKSSTEKALEEQRGRLLAAVDVKEAIYLNEFYQPKEYQLIHAYTSKRANQVFIQHSGARVIIT